MPAMKRPAAAQLASVAQKRKAVRRSLQIQVFSVDGRTLESKVDSEDDVAKVKQIIAKKWGIPPSCQKLVHGVKLTQDSHLLGRYCPGKEDTVKLSYVLTLDEVCKRLGPKINEVVKLQALKDLRKLGQRGANIIGSVCSCLNDACPEVRKSALATIKEISSDQRLTVDSILASYAEWQNIAAPCYAGKTEWAAKILRALAENDNEYAVTSTVGLIWSLSGHAKVWYAGVLRGLAEDPLHAADLLIADLIQKDAGLKPGSAFELVEVLDTFVFFGPPKHLSPKVVALHMFSSLSTYLEAPDEKTLQNALVILRRLGCDYFTDEPPSTWKQDVHDNYRKLVTTIANVVRKNAPSSKTVELALAALEPLVCKRDEELAAFIVTLLDILAQERINCSALRVLRKCAERGNASAITAASALLTSNSKKVRAAAMKTLSRLVDYRVYVDDDDSYSYPSDTD